MPLRQLEKHGHEVTFRSASDADGNKVPVTLRDMQGYDLIVGQRMNAYRGLDTWRRARTPLSRLVYETDDDVFSVSPANFQAYHVYQQGEVQDAVLHMAEVSDLITVTTDHLAGVMREQTGNGNVVVLPNCVPEWVPDMPSPPNPRPCIGWQGGASHGVDVGLIVKPVRRFLKRFPGWDLRLGGTDYRPTFKAGDQAKFVKWIPVHEDPAAYYATINYDIGLAPLVVTEFDLSKSPVKVLEYAARGIPSVATDCEVYRSFIRHGENGFLVKREHEWLHYISLLASDNDLRLRMGEVARKDARDRTIEANWEKWEQAYASLFRPARVG